MEFCHLGGKREKEKEKKAVHILHWDSLGKNGQSCQILRGKKIEIAKFRQY